MFTGIIESVGKVHSLRPASSGYMLEIDSGLDLKNENIGDSIAVDGVCLTATSISGSRFTAQASKETAMRSTIGSLRANSSVNIERSIRLSSRLGGHIVLGHVDCVGHIRGKSLSGESSIYRIEFDRKYSRYLIEKGSVAVDGVSLTVNAVFSNAFELNIIPHTLKSTSLTLKNPGDSVNIEFDIIGKYLEKLIQNNDGSPLGDLLKENGFI